jgi:hypothetical protein
MGNPTRFTSGFATVPSSKPLGNYPYPDPFHTSGNPSLGVVTYMNDYFDSGTTTAYTLTGTPTFSLTAGTGGVATLTPSGAAVVGTMARTASAFQFISGQKFWYLTRFQLSGVGAGVIPKVGLQVGAVANTTNDSIFFQKVTGIAGAVQLVSTVATVSTVLATVQASTVASTWIDVGFYYDGKDLNVYANDALVSKIANITIGAVAATSTVTNGALTPFIQITPVTSETLSQDYVLVAQEVVR